MNTEPEIFWCSYCGQNMWFIAQTTTQPEELICEDCKIKYKRNRDELPKMQMGPV